MGALIPYETLSDIARFSRDKGYNLAFTYGTCDYLHLGHWENVRTIREIIGEETILVAGIKNDRIVRLLKGANRPFCPEEVRALTVSALPEVDFVAISPELGMRGAIGLGFLEILDPDYYFVPPDAVLLGVREIICQRLCVDIIITNRISPADRRISTTGKIIAERRSLFRGNGSL